MKGTARSSCGVEKRRCAESLASGLPCEPAGRRQQGSLAGMRAVLRSHYYGYLQSVAKSLSLDNVGEVWAVTDERE
jgi:hypothetical protein